MDNTAYVPEKRIQINQIEYTAIITSRAEAIAGGEKPEIEFYENMSPIEIARKEFYFRVMPCIIEKMVNGEKKLFHMRQIIYTP